MERGRFEPGLMGNKIIFCVALCLYAAVVQVQSQDYIITHQNDTVQCQLISHPRKDGLKPAGKFKNGYRKIVAVLANDSMRTYMAGDIKGYYRKKHGKDLLCNGFFETKKIVNPSIRLAALNGGNLTQFMRRISYGPHANLYAHYAEWGRRRYLYYYLSHGSNPQEVTEVRNRKHLMELLSDTDITKELDAFTKKEKKRLANMVLAYNRVKTIEAQRQEETQ